ncbi:hypothetical protein U9M48_038840 [Paspalum notatum var. saurae]|uniref:Uncharacterized protein n=1 Tax=Paspalum notatum var. saurae TaxID=547442 RepID=A0AAQ3XDZ4_PASNO
MWLRLAAALADLSSVVPVRVPLMDLWVTGSIPILANLFLRYSPVAKKSMKLDDGLLFLQAELAPLYVRPQATLSNSHVHAPQCRQAASDPPPASTDLSSGQSSRSMVIAPLKQYGVLSF